VQLLAAAVLNPCMQPSRSTDDWLACLHLSMRWTWCAYTSHPLLYSIHTPVTQWMYACEWGRHSCKLYKRLLANKVVTISIIIHPCVGHDACMQSVQKFKARVCMSCACVRDDRMMIDRLRKYEDDTTGGRRNMLTHWPSQLLHTHIRTILRC